MSPRVLVVDDSSFVRQAVARALEEEGVEVCGFARDGRDAVEKNLALEPDVIVLDLQMPTMNGVEALRRIQETRPVPVIVFASLTAKGAELAVEALAAGAVDILPKVADRHVTHALASRVWALAAARGEGARPRPARRRAAVRVVVVASSTGGPPLVERLLASLPADYPVPVVVAQHMPAGFTGSFARRLDGLAAVRVFEGADGATVGPGEACILPGGAVSTLHAADDGSPRSFRIRSDTATTLAGARPNASALFFSALGATGGDACAVVLTGMGADGADAVPALLAAGGTVLAQDPGEAVIPSMPNAAIAAGARVGGSIDRLAASLVALAARPVEGAP